MNQIEKTHMRKFLNQEWVCKSNAGSFFEVRVGKSGILLATAYYKDSTPMRALFMTKEEARSVAEHIALLPELLKKT